MIYSLDGSWHVLNEYDDIQIEVIGLETCFVVMPFQFCGPSGLVFYFSSKYKCDVIYPVTN